MAKNSSNNYEHHDKMGNEFDLTLGNYGCDQLHLFTLTINFFIY